MQISMNSNCEFKSVLRRAKKSIKPVQIPCNPRCTSLSGDEDVILLFSLLSTLLTLHLKAITPAWMKEIAKDVSILGES